MKATEYLGKRKYPGRIIIAGHDAKGDAVLFYAIMGRSENSRNRIFTLSDGILKTEPAAPSLLKDDSLIIYNAKRETEEGIIIANGDHTDTIHDSLRTGESLMDALIKREYEPDEPNFTPRIGLYHEKANGTSSFMIIRKDGMNTEREIYHYVPSPGWCHIIHTYEESDAPLISFSKAPVLLEVDEGSEEELMDCIWNALDEDNRIALYGMLGGKEFIINGKA